MATAATPTRVRELTNDLFQRIAVLGTVDFITPESAPLMDLDYFNVHSGERLLLPFISELSEQGDFMDTLAKLVSARYADKWNRSALALKADYDPITNRSIDRMETPDITRTRTGSSNGEETTSGNGTDTATTTGNLTKSETRNDDSTKSDSLTRETEGTSTRSESTDIDTTTTRDDQNTVFGFNSQSDVGRDGTTSTGTSNTKGDATDNKVDLSESESEEKAGTSTETRTGKTTGSEDRNETTTRNTTDSVTKTKEGTTEGTEKESGTRTTKESGYVGESPAALLAKELSVLELHLLWQIVYNDVDRLITQSAY